MLAEQDKFLRLHGFVKIKQSFTAQEVTRLTRAVDTAAAQVRAGHRDDDSGFVWMLPVTAMDPVFAKLFDDDRVSGLAEALHGPTCLYLGHSVAGVWDHRTGWHAKIPTPQRRDLAITVCLDFFDASDGGMVVLPGSHYDSYHAGLRSAFDSGLLNIHNPRLWGARPAAPTRPGDVHVFDAALWHCGSGTAHPSRQISFAFHAWPHLDKASISEFAARSALWQQGHRLYDQEFLASATGRRLRMIQPVIDLGFADPSRPALTRDQVIESAYLPTPRIG